MTGVRTTGTADSPEALRPRFGLSSEAIAWTPDHDVVVGPPGTAHAVMTSRAPAIVPDCSAVRSMAISCASAPAGLRGHPVGTPAGPACGHSGTTITGPGSRVLTGPGVADDSGSEAIGRAAMASSSP